jgi:hypothetical protein
MEEEAIEGAAKGAEGVVKYFENRGHGVMYGIIFLLAAGGTGYLTYYLWHQRQEHLEEIEHGKHVMATITDAESEHEEKKEIYKLGFEFDVGGKPFEVKAREVEKDVYEKFGKGAQVDVVYPRDGEEGLAEITEAMKAESKTWKIAVAGGVAGLCLLLSIWGFIPGAKKEEEGEGKEGKGEKGEGGEGEEREESRPPPIEFPSEHHHHHHHQHHEHHKEKEEEPEEEEKLEHHHHHHEQHHKEKEKEKDSHHHAHVKIKSSKD